MKEIYEGILLLDYYVFKPAIYLILYETPINHINEYNYIQNKNGELFSIKYCNIYLK